MQQETLTGCLGKKAKLDFKSMRAVEITNLVQNMLINDLQPLSFTEDVGLRAFFILMSAGLPG